MYFDKNDLELTNDILIEIIKVGREVFGNGIYVPCDDSHPCGWDFISFDMIEEYSDILDYKFENSDISDGCYWSHVYENKTLKEILSENQSKFKFER